MVSYLILINLNQFTSHYCNICYIIIYKHSHFIKDSQKNIFFLMDYFFNTQQLHLVFLLSLNIF